MKKIYGLVAPVFALAMLCGCGGKDSSVPEGALKVGSYNIRTANGDKGTPNAWAERGAELAALIRKLDMDVFGLQEVMPVQAKFLQGQLPDYEYVGDFRNADRKSGEASPVFFRKDRFEAAKTGTFWLSETPDTPGLKGWGAACPRICTWVVLKDRKTGKNFCFANTHTDHVSALARREGMLLIIKRMEEFGGGVPIVFTGDHNCRETEEPAQAVAKILKNTIYASKTPPAGPWRTFNGWSWRDEEFSAADAMKLPEHLRNANVGSPDGTRDKDGRHIWEKCGARIDYIYVSPGVEVFDCATHADPRPGKKLYPSDHFPLTATIRF